RLLERIDERVKLVDELLAMDHDFTVDEEIVIDPDVADYPKDEAEARELWRKRIKYDLLILKTEAKEAAEKKKNHKEGDAADESPRPVEEPRARLARRYHSFAKRMHQTNNSELLEMYLTSMTTAYDPHSSYMAPVSAENF